MSKELEAFHKIMETYGNTNSLEGTYNDFLTIKQALQRLEAIENAKPSEALEKLNIIEENLTYELRKLDKIGNQKLAIEIAVGLVDKFEEAIKPIKQALIKADLDKHIAEEYDEIIKEQEKVLKILKEHKINIYRLLDVESVSQYNEWENDNLTEEEFELLKRYCNDTL